MRRRLVIVGHVPQFTGSVVFLRSIKHYLCDVSERFSQALTLRHHFHRLLHCLSSSRHSIRPPELTASQETLTLTILTNQRKYINCFAL